MRDFLETPEFCAACYKAAIPAELNGYKWLRAFSFMTNGSNHRGLGSRRFRSIKKIKYRLVRIAIAACGGERRPYFPQWDDGGLDGPPGGRADLAPGLEHAPQDL
jgi:hypothetical protein